MNGSNRSFVLFAVLAFGIPLAIIGLGVAVGFVLFSRIASQPASLPTANLLVKGHFDRHYAVSATFDVPRSDAKVQSRPSLQFMLVQPAYGYVEAGIIRTGRSAPLRGFVGYTSRRIRGGSFYLATLSDRPHRVEVAVDGEPIVVSIDGKPVYRLRRSELFSGDVRSILAGTAFGLPEESAFGTISDFEVRRDGDAVAHAVVDPCIVTTPGVSFVPTATGWELHGVNDTHGKPVNAACASAP